VSAAIEEAVASSPSTTPNPTHVELGSLFYGRSVRLAAAGSERVFKQQLSQAIKTVISDDKSFVTPQQFSAILARQAAEPGSRLGSSPETSSMPQQQQQQQQQVSEQRRDDETGGLRRLSSLRRLPTPSRAAGTPAAGSTSTSSQSLPLVNCSRRMQFLKTLPDEMLPVVTPLLHRVRSHSSPLAWPCAL
jgi:hypothetical protein